ncbi:flippase-like domain-containing protein [Flavobacterium sp. xlx-214]|uniref:lysylphosphatidylglycerol synthase domain-containing protein n=1 Tax=unclassified Flavobacterium TaxID=196869 RepID=UPI0013D86A55|nr:MULTISPECIES: lysylphosphatidylglycerol synthase domain-containing protein [unclassified Flavobacterium]MBA5792891.1 flippase-like domain-containing protein [Flavobacterium sp. xlx-221]QMI84775.1 flippase-like domain-containing protein [Flavobacterium sp. xlx-214]
MKFLSPKIKQFLSLLLKFIVVGLAFYFIQSQLSEKEWNWNIIQQQWEKPKAFFYIIGLVVLTFLNRFIEILKWKNLAQILEPISVWESTKQVLIGITFGIVTPNGIGEYAGKAWFYPRKDAGKAIFLNAVCNGIQVIYSVGFGLIGTLYINHLHHFIPTTYIYLFFGVLLAVVLLIFSIKNISIKGFSLQAIFKYLGEIKKEIHIKNIVLAFLRYVVLIHQYYLLYRFFDVDIAYLTLLAVVASIYLLASSLPNFQAVDFALKGSVAIFLFGFFGVNEWVIALVATSIWLLNLVIPITIGSIFLLLFNPKKKEFLNQVEIEK